MQTTNLASQKIAEVPVKPELDLFASYMAMVENSVGSNLFKNLFFRINGQSVDVLENGDLACATFVTTILFTFGLIQERHTTVLGTVDDLLKSGWKEIKEPRKGAVILWGYKKRDDGTQGKHRHVGFFVDPETAISNDSETRTIVRHHLTYGTFDSGEPRRDILAYYWHLKLDQ